MRDVAELIAGWVYGIQITSAEQWLLRLVVLASAAAATLLSWWWFPVLAAPALLTSAAVLALASIVRPDSLAPLLTVGVVAIWWLGGAANAEWWQGLVVALAVALFHLAAAHAGAAPSYARITARAAGRMLRATAAYLAATLVGLAVVVGVAAIPDGILPRGSWWVAAGLLAVGTVAVGVVAALRVSGGPPLRRVGEG